MSLEIKTKCDFCNFEGKDEQDLRQHCLFEHQFLIPQCSTDLAINEAAKFDKIRKEYKKIVKKRSYYKKTYFHYDFYTTIDNYYKHRYDRIIRGMVLCEYDPELLDVEHHCFGNYHNQLRKKENMKIYKRFNLVAKRYYELLLIIKKEGILIE